MSECRDCGATIVWAKQLNGRWSRPLVPVVVYDPEALNIRGLSVIYDGIVRTPALPTFYMEHICESLEDRSEADWIGTPTGVVTEDPEAPALTLVQTIRADETALSVQCPHCGARQWKSCTKPDGTITNLHADRVRLFENPQRNDVGPYARGPWPPRSDGSQQWRTMRHWLFDHSSLLTDLSSAPAPDPLTVSTSTPSPTTQAYGSAEAAGSPARPSSKERSTHEVDSRGSPGEGSTEDLPAVLRTSTAEPDSARDAGHAREARPKYQGNGRGLGRPPR